MEEANSRLERYEKLGMKSTNRPQLSQSSYGPFRSGSSSVLRIRHRYPPPETTAQQAQ